MATMLVVDDDPDVLNSMCAVLSSTRHEVERASNGLAALSVIERVRIDLLLTDVVMRGMNGFNLARQAVLRRPAIKILYYSGFSEFTLGHVAGQMLGKLLQKPIRASDLVREVDEALTARRPASA